MTSTPGSPFRLTARKGWKGTEPISPINANPAYAKSYIGKKGSKPFQPFHTTVESLVEWCKFLDVRLHITDGQLVADAPVGTIDPELRAEISAHKDELLQLLGRCEPTKPTEPPGRSDVEVSASWEALGLVETSAGVWEEPGLPDFDRGVTGDQFAAAPTLPPRPAGRPSHGLTRGRHVVELPRTEAEERSDPTQHVTGPAWPGWYPPE